MSEFSDSYHLMTADPQAAEELLKRAGIEGYVFPLEQGWATLVADGFVFRPNFDLIEANQGVLLHLVSSLEHGWYISIYQGSDRVVHYECYWENELYIHDTEFELAKFKELLADRLNLAREAAETECQKIFYPAKLDYYCHPVMRLANLLGLRHVDWVAYGSVREDQECGRGAFSVKLIK